MRSHYHRIATGLAVVPLVALFLAVPATAQDAGSSFTVAVIDVGRLVTDSVAGKQVIEQLQQLSEVKSADLQVLADELKGIETQIQEGRLSLSETRISELQRELEDKTIAFRRARDDADRELKEFQAEQFTEIENLIMPILNQIGQQRGYTMIFNKYESGLVFAQESVDITDEILQAFDASMSTAPEAGAEGGGS